MSRMDLFQSSTSFLALMISFSAITTSKGTPNVIDARAQSISRGVHNGVAFANFKAHKFSYLNITALGADYVINGEECGFACVVIPSCFSYNLAAVYDINGRVLCELLPSDKYNNSDKFISSQLFHHFSIGSPCMSEPCENGGTCVSIYEKNSYVCLCTKGFTGSICQTAVECTSYSSLTSGDRKTTHHTKTKKCDSNLNGWYRFQGAAGTRMPTSCPPKDRCNSLGTGWLKGGHPTVAKGKVTRKVCFHYTSGCCQFSRNIKVRNCGSFYVYHFSGTPACNLRYCGSN